MSPQPEQAVPTAGGSLASLGAVAVAGRRRRSEVFATQPAPAATGSFSIRIAVALNSAVPDFGSVASIVRRFVATSSWKWSVMNVRPGPEGRVDPDRGLDLAAPRDHADALAFGQAEPLGVLGADVERLAAPQRRRVAAGLDAGVVRVEPAPGREADREVVVELVDGRVVVDRDERDAIARDRVLPEAAVEEQLARVVLVVARPLQPTELLQPLVRHAGMDRRQRSDLVPGVLGGLPAELLAHPSGELRDDPQVVAGLAGRVERLADALDPPLGVRDGALRLGPGRGRGQDDVGELGGRGQEEVLDDHELEAFEQPAGARLVGLRLERVLADDNRRRSGRRAPSRRTCPTGASPASAAR